MTATILITGANRGIGLSLAKLYKSKGWKVVGTCRNVANASDLSDIADQVVDLDVTSEHSIGQLRDKLGDQKIDFLINNAGLYNKLSFEQLSAAPMVDEFVTNAVGPLLISKELLPLLKKSTAPHIVNITSRMGSIADNSSGGSYGYRASKAALNAMTKSWSIDVPDVPILVVHPGFIQTGMTSNRGEMGPDECVQELFQVFDEFVSKPQQESKYKSGSFVHRNGSFLPW